MTVKCSAAAIKSKKAASATQASTRESPVCSRLYYTPHAYLIRVGVRLHERVLTETLITIRRNTYHQRDDRCTLQHNETAREQESLRARTESRSRVCTNIGTSVGSLNAMARKCV